MADKSLNGRTIWITRPRAQAGKLAQLLARSGALVQAVPVIKIAPPKSWKTLDGALRNLHEFDTLVFTSANTVAMFFARARRILRRVPRRPAHLYAIGPGTVRALARAGWTRAKMPKDHEGAALARFMGKVRGRRILLPRATIARDVLPNLLSNGGARVLIAPAYRTVPDSGGLRRIRRAARSAGGPPVDWVTFTSASTVDRFVGAIGGRLARLFFGAAAQRPGGRAPRAASIGPITSAALRRHGIEPAAQASPCTVPGLAAAVSRHSRPAPRKDLIAALRKALHEAGKIARARFGKVAIRYKGPANLVTAADHACETKILEIILKRFPHHDFMTEERAPRLGRSDYTWIIDPIDGTTNYAHGFPVCCISIALLRRGRPVLAGIYDPFRNELFSAERGRGAALNGKRITVSRIRSVKESLLLTGFAYDRVDRARYLLNFYRLFMVRSHDVRRSGSAALDLAWTAAGRVDGYWELNLSPWDVAAGLLIVEEAGGKVTDYSGKPWTDLRNYGIETVASNGRIHAAMLRILKKGKKSRQILSAHSLPERRAKRTLKKKAHRDAVSRAEIP